MKELIELHGAEAGYRMMVEWLYVRGHLVGYCVSSKLNDTLQMFTI